MSSKKLFDILPEDLCIRIEGDGEIKISKLSFDSRLVEVETLFFAIEGEKVDGHDFVELAIKNGASALVVSKMPQNLNPKICYLQVEDTRKALAIASNTFYDSPSSKLKLIGITGTNGKTTVATLLYQFFKKMGLKSGLISTVKYAYNDHSEIASHTTPNPLKLNQLLAEMVECGCEYVFMEVSSHAIDQKRIKGLNFAGGVFTNITHDHLDYHKTFKVYLNTKKLFFDELSKEAFVVYNRDDKNGEVMVQNCSARKMGYGLHHLSEVKGKLLSNSIEGLQLRINEHEVFSRLVGKYNAYNILAAYGTALSLDIEKENILIALSMVKGAEGRFELIRGEKKKIFGIVDYAHTPDALKNILETLNELKSGNTKIITVVGCGGDRDETKRPKMAFIANRLSAKVVLTNDNPRTEDPDLILKQMMDGVGEESQNVLIISDRKQAIKTAVMLANDGDVVLVAGKGHEKYQDIGGVKHPFDDKAELKKELI